jgi:hypothetical protein
MQTVARALDLALLKAGRSKLARTEMIAITTSSSINVNAGTRLLGKVTTHLKDRVQYERITTEQTSPK